MRRQTWSIPIVRVRALRCISTTRGGIAGGHVGDGFGIHGVAFALEMAVLMV